MHLELTESNEELQSMTKTLLVRENFWMGLFFSIVTLIGVMVCFASWYQKKYNKFREAEVKKIHEINRKNNNEELKDVAYGNKRRVTLEAQIEANRIISDAQYKAEQI